MGKVKTIYCTEDIVQKLKIASALDKLPMYKKIENSLNFEDKFKPLLKEISELKENSSFSLEFPDKVVSLKVESVYNIEN
jgi:hypothetical protein